MVNYKLKRTLPFLRLLHSTSSPTRKRRMLHTFPGFVVDDIVEILYNVLHKNVTVQKSEHRSALMRQRKFLSKLLGSHKQKRRQLFYKQKGGFLGAIVPVVTSVLATILGSAL